LLGPAFETFVQAVLILLLVVTPLVLVLRKPVARMYARLCQEDQKEMAEVRAHELDLEKEQEARHKAIEEINRDCDPVSGDAKCENQDEGAVTPEADRSERTKQ
jgi:hypothetical protein